MAPLFPAIPEERKEFSTSELTEQLYQEDSMLTACSPTSQKCMSMKIQYRGNTTPKLINAAIQSIKSQKIFQFCDWCPTGIRLGLNY